MSRYIDADRLKFVAEKNFGHGTIKPILQLIDGQPTAEVVEVVRCKDCKFYPGGYFSDDRIMIETYMHCPNFKDDGFCSFGRRKKE